MKVLLISTSDLRGGAAIASSRLLIALRKYYTEVRMLTREKLSDNDAIFSITNNFLDKIHGFLCILLERLLYAFHMKSKESLFYFSPANVGKHISGFYEVKDADILHFHWLNQAFISVRELHKLFASGKKIVWTLHDMWPFTGGCHYSGECNFYISECGNCPFLRSHKKYDLSYRVFKRKMKAYKGSNMTIVTPSKWMAEKVRESSLMGPFNTFVIPNPIDTEIFKPEDKLTIRKIKNLPQDKFIILAGSANLKDKRKGFRFILKALNLFITENPGVEGKIALLTFGKSSEVPDLQCDHYSLPYLSDENSLAMLYQLSDVYILPSLEDNLPGTVMESLSCGTPVVAFNTGGIPEMIDHKFTGYLGAKNDLKDLKEGLKWIFTHSDPESLKNNCRKKVLENYSQDIIAEKYYSLYKSLID